MGNDLEMLRGRRDFEALQRSSDSKVHPLVVARFSPNDLDRSRFGLSTGRRVGTAVARNRVRRRLREILRALAPAVAPGWDILIVARPAAATATFPELRAAVERVLGARRILGRSGSRS